MRYALIVFGFIAFAIGLLIASRDVRDLWMLSGVVSSVVGLATCEIVNAISLRRSPANYRENLREYQSAVEQGDRVTAASVLTSNGVDQELAESIALSAIDE